MFLDHRQEASVIAFQLLATLEEYERDLQSLSASSSDAALQAASARFDTMRSLAAGLPKLSVCWVEVLISRHELTARHWAAESGQQNGDVCALDEVQDRHAAAIAALRAQVRSVLVHHG